MHDPTPIPNVHNASALLRQGRLADAERMCRRLLQINPRDAVAVRLRGLVALEERRVGEALALLEHALTLAPDDPLTHASLGRTLMTQARYDEAIAHFDTILAQDAEHRIALAGKAQVLERQARFDEARSLLAPIVAAGRDSPEIAGVHAALLRHEGRDEDALACLERHLTTPDLDPRVRSRLLFPIGRAYERLERYDRSMDAWEQANAAVRPAHDVAGFRRRVDRCMEVFAPGRLETLPRAATDDARPVLIVGMLRCGSTLVDQILAAHPDVASAGENEALPRLVHELEYGAGARERGVHRWFPALAESIGDAALGRLATQYIEAIGAAGPGKTRIVDKHLGSFLWLGLVDMMLPGARIIHCRRHPMATCFSCFIQPLSPRAHPYASDLRTLGAHYREYDRLMRHWAAVLRLPMLEVRYETLVADQESETRRIVEFCGLPWDDACLRFHETGRHVATMSYDLVRQPMYGSSVRRYAPYEAHLGPLREALGGLAEE